MNAFDKAVTFVLSVEGNYSNDPADPGGETKYGISKASFPDIDIKNLTRDQAIEIYRTQFWNRCNCDMIPAQLGMVLFDSAINQGPSTAIRMLQKSLNVTADGVMGPSTIAACLNADVRQVLPDFIARRAMQYATQREIIRFGLGWFRRLAACQQLVQEPLQ